MLSATIKKLYLAITQIIEKLINLIEDIAKNIEKKDNKKDINIIDVFSKLGKN